MEGGERPVTDAELDQIMSTPRPDKSRSQGRLSGGGNSLLPQEQDEVRGVSEACPGKLTLGPAPACLPGGVPIPEPEPEPQQPAYPQSGDLTRPLATVPATLAPGDASKDTSRLS